MTKHPHPITPPPELVGQWLCSEDYQWGPLEQASITITTNRLQNVATQAAQWGADQELEACCEWIPKNTPWDEDNLRAARRPQPRGPAMNITDAIGIMESIAGVTDESTPVGEAWDVILKYIYNPANALPTPEVTDD